MYSSSDSEFESETDEHVIKLYTQLHFGTAKELPSKLSVISSNNDSLNFNSQESLQAEDDIKVDNEIEDATRNIFNKDLEESLQDEDINQVDNEIEDVTRNIFNKDLEEKICNFENYKKRKTRERHSSICSTDSISGKIPLDDLYCNTSLGLNENEQPLKTILENSSDSHEINENNEESRCDITAKKPSQAVSSPLNNNNEQVYTSSDDEVCILPPTPAKPIETVDIDSDLNNFDELNKKSRKVKLKNKSKSKKEIVVISSESEYSDSSDSEIEFIRATKMFTSKPLVLNLSKDYTKSTKTRSPKAKEFTQSQVIFSKSRALTKKTPSCISWTNEMASLYDSDISDEFSVEDVHHSQNSHPRNWKICSEDRVAFFKKKKRYFQEIRCNRCREFGHSVKDCSKIPHCLYCGSSEHANISNCPQNCCLRCGGQPHAFCANTSFRLVCKECGNFGHESNLCPDIWRRFHATVSGSKPIIPEKSSNNIRNKHSPYCYNCGKKGHYGHECRATARNKYILSSTQIFSYEAHQCTLFKKSNSIPIPTHPSGFSEIEPNPTYVYDLPLPNTYENDLPLPSTCQNPTILKKVLWMSRDNLKQVVGRKQIAIQEIQIQTQAELTCFFSGTKDNRIVMKGTKESIASASKLISMLKSKRPKKDYEKFNTLIKEKTAVYKKELVKARKNAKKMNINIQESELKVSEEKGNISPLSKPKAKSLSSIMVISNSNVCKENEPNSESPIKATFPSCKPFPIPLPFDRSEAILAVKAVLRKFTPAKLLKEVNSSVEYLSRIKSDEKSRNNENFVKHFQFLSKVVHSGDKSMKSLNAFRYKMEASKSKLLNPRFYKLISDVYTKIVDPPTGSLNSIIKAAGGIFLMKSTPNIEKSLGHTDQKLITNNRSPKTKKRARTRKRMRVLKAHRQKQANTKRGEKVS